MLAQLLDHSVFSSGKLVYILQNLSSNLRASGEVLLSVSLWYAHFLHQVPRHYCTWLILHHRGRIQPIPAKASGSQSPALLSSPGSK